MWKLLRLAVGHLVVAFLFSTSLILVGEWWNSDILSAGDVKTVCGEAIRRLGPKFLKRVLASIGFASSLAKYWSSISDVWVETQDGKVRKTRCLVPTMGSQCARTSPSRVATLHLTTFRQVFLRKTFEKCTKLAGVWCQFFSCVSELFITTSFHIILSRPKSPMFLKSFYQDISPSLLPRSILRTFTVIKVAVVFRPCVTRGAGLCGQAGVTVDVQCLHQVNTSRHPCGQETIRVGTCVAINYHKRHKNRHTWRG